MTIGSGIANLYGIAPSHGVVQLLKSVEPSMPSRPLGGWLMTYGKLSPDGKLVETVDREDQVVDAARELGRIDFGPYIESGLWNDTHDEQVIVGLPTLLEFHDESTLLAKAHGKVGYWTAGHLWDRADRRSWEAHTDYVPSERELDAADRFWSIAEMLKGLPRGLAFSAHGEMRLAACGRRITWCRVRQAAVCELPMNPDATAEVLELAKGQRHWMPLRKDGGAASIPNPQKLAPHTETTPMHGELVARYHGRMEHLVRMLIEQYFLSRDEAVAFVRRYVQTTTQEEPDAR